jgi:hypothetical protein
LRSAKKSHRQPASVFGLPFFSANFEKNIEGPLPHPPDRKLHSETGNQTFYGWRFRKPEHSIQAEAKATWQVTGHARQSCNAHQQVMGTTGYGTVSRPCHSARS